MVWIYQHNISNHIDCNIRRYFSIARNYQATKEAFGDWALDIIGEDFVRDPSGYLRNMCDFLEITCSEDYFDDCSSTVDSVPSVTRSLLVWKLEQIDKVYTSMQSIEFSAKVIVHRQLLTKWSTNRTTFHLQTSDFYHQSSLLLLSPLPYCGETGPSKQDPSRDHGQNGCQEQRRSWRKSWLKNSLSSEVCLMVSLTGPGLISL